MEQLRLKEFISHQLLSGATAVFKLEGDIVAARQDGPTVRVWNVNPFSSLEDSASFDAIKSVGMLPCSAQLHLGEGLHGFSAKMWWDDFLYKLLDSNIATFETSVA